MNKIIFLILILSFSSCLTLKQRERVCATCPVKTIIKDSIVVKIEEKVKTVIIHDTIITVSDNPCKEMCDSLGQLKRGFTKMINTSRGTTIVIKEKDGKLNIEDNLNGLKTQGIFKDTLIDKFHSKLEQIPQCFREHRTSFDNFCRWFFYIFSILILGFGILKWRDIL